MKLDKYFDLHKYLSVFFKILNHTLAVNKKTPQSRQYHELKNKEDGNPMMFWAAGNKIGYRV